MSSSSSDPLTIADRALLRALQVWGASAVDRYWDRFNPSWRQTLRNGWSSISLEGPETARVQLQSEHSAEGRPDFRRIHSTWWVRALKEETPAVQRAVVAQAPEAIRESLRIGLGLRRDELRGERPPLAEPLRCALALWSERLVGDIAERDDDPPVIVALTRFDLRNVARLVSSMGLVKWAMAGDTPPRLHARDRVRLVQLRDSLGAVSPSIQQPARRDVSKHGQAERHAEARLGLVTVARLLEVAEPYRVRWALQHLPYKAAKLVRTLMNPRPRREAVLAAWENNVLRAAWEQLRAEGRFDVAWGNVP